MFGKRTILIFAAVCLVLSGAIIGISATSTSLGLVKPAKGDLDWLATFNTNFQKINNLFTGAQKTGGINASGLSINGVPVGTSTDTYWSVDGAGEGGIGYASAVTVGGEHLGKTRTGIDTAIAASAKSVSLTADIVLESDWDLSAYTGRFATNGHQISGAYTFTAPADFAGSNNCFGATTTVSFPSGSALEPKVSWFGTNATAFQAAVASVEGTVSRLIVNAPITLTDDLTTTCALSINNQCPITTTGYTLTINGPFSAGLYQVFSGSGTVTFGTGAVKSIQPQWWYDGTNGSTALQAAITAAATIDTGIDMADATPHAGTVIDLTGWYVSLDTAITIPAAKSGYTIRGGTVKASDTFTDDAAIFTYSTAANAKSDITFDGVVIDCNHRANGIYLYTFIKNKIINCHIKHQKSYGIKTGGAVGATSFELIAENNFIEEYYNAETGWGTPTSTGIVIGDYTSDHHITNNIINYCLHPFELIGDAVRMWGNHFYVNSTLDPDTTRAIIYAGSNWHDIVGNYFDCVALEWQSPQYVNVSFNRFAMNTGFDGKSVVVMKPMIAGHVVGGVTSVGNQFYCIGAATINAYGYDTSSGTVNLNLTQTIIGDNTANGGTITLKGTSGFVTQFKAGGTADTIDMGAVLLFDANVKSFHYSVVAASGAHWYYATLGGSPTNDITLTDGSGVGAVNFTSYVWATSSL